ncbi:MAG: hypothetical protein FD129_1314, partial [bacterium]
VGLMCGLTLYLGWEWSSYARGNRAGLAPVQIRRRLIGGILLLTDLAWWLAADVLMSGRTAPERLLLMLLGMLPVPIAMMLAVREAGYVARQYTRSRLDLARKIVSEDESGKPPA